MAKAAKSTGSKGKPAAKGEAKPSGDSPKRQGDKLENATRAASSRKGK
jgi:hypothetical protein